MWSISSIKMSSVYALHVENDAQFLNAISALVILAFPAFIDICPVTKIYSSK